MIGAKNTILPFTKQYPKKEPSKEIEPKENEDEEEGEGEEGMEGQGEEIKAEITEGKVETEGEEEKISDGEEDTPQLKENTGCLTNITPPNTRYGLRNRTVPTTSVTEPVEVELPHVRSRGTRQQAVAHLDKDTSLDSGKAASQDTATSSLPEGRCVINTDDKLSSSMSQDDKASVSASQAESESIFSNTPVQPVRCGASVATLTPMQMLVSHLPNDHDEDLQGYLTQQVDSEVSEVPDVCGELPYGLNIAWLL